MVVEILWKNCGRGIKKNPIKIFFKNPPKKNIQVWGSDNLEAIYKKSWCFDLVLKK